MNLRQLLNTTYDFFIEGKDEVEIKAFDRELKEEADMLDPRRIVGEQPQPPPRPDAGPPQPRSQNVDQLMAAFHMRTS